jgi:hypothetical protein
MKTLLKHFSYLLFASLGLSGSLMAQPLTNTATIGKPSQNQRIGAGLQVMGPLQARQLRNNASLDSCLVADTSGTFHNVFSPYWKTTGNAGTVVGTNFVGTTDNVGLLFKTNSANAMYISSAQKVGIGTTTPSNKLEVNGTLQATNSDGMLIYNHPQELSLFGSTFYLPSTKCQYVDTTDNYHYTSGVEIIPESLTGQPDAPQSIFSAIDPNSNNGYFQRITKANGFEFARARGFSSSLAEQVIFNSTQFLITSHGLGTNIVLQPDVSDGNVGIGVSGTPTYKLQIGDGTGINPYEIRFGDLSSPNAVLGVDGGGYFQLKTGNEGIGKVLTSDAYGNASWQTPGGGGSGWSLTGNSGTDPSTNYIGTSDAQDFQVKANNNALAYFHQNTQHVSLGSTTTDSAWLSIGIGSHHDGYHGIWAYNTQYGYPVFTVEEKGNTVIAAHANYTGHPYALDVVQYGYNGSSGGALHVNQVSNTGNPLAVFEGHGNVGINTTTPSALLDVKGSTSNGISNTVSSNGHAIGDYNTVNGGDLPIAIGVNNVVNPSNSHISIAIGRSDTVTGQSSIAIGSNLNNSTDESVLIGYNQNTTIFKADGNVGIGTLTPNNTLDIAGTLHQYQSNSMFGASSEITANALGVLITDTAPNLIGNYAFQSAVATITRTNTSTNISNTLTFSDNFSVASDVRATNSLLVDLTNNLVGINTNTPQAVLDVTSTNSGILFPRVANAAAVTSPVEGMVIYSLDAHKLQVYTSSVWETIISAP